MITQEKLKAILAYDPETGIFTWVAPHCRRLKPGDVAGSIASSNGRRVIHAKIFGQPMLANRLAWLYVTGELPPAGFVVDHKNGDPTDDSFKNLRLCSQHQNTLNQRIRINNVTGVKGVSVLPKGKFHARLRVNGKVTLIGDFQSVADAAKAVQAARERFHGEFANHG